MDEAFWHTRWEKAEIGFHEEAGNKHLARHFDALGLCADARIFVPLCGKTRDIGWLLARGCRVVGVELSEIAVVALFEDMGLQPEVTQTGRLTQYAAAGVNIFVGDFFALDADTLGPVDAIYDRAALVALPPEMRVRYAAHLGNITSEAMQLLVTFVYDQSVMPGPPFSVDQSIVEALYGSKYDVSLLQTEEVAGGLKGRCPAREQVWRLGPV